MGIQGMIALSVIVGMDLMHGGVLGWIIAMLLAGLSVRPMFLRRGVMNAMVSSTKEALVPWLLSSALMNRSDLG